MGVMINKKRCDNADVCSCIETCPTKAFFYDTEGKTVAVKNELCINCRQCMISCEAGAVKVYRTDEEKARLKTEYDEDIMTEDELFQERYGASSIEEENRLNVEDLDELIDEANKALLIEFYTEDEAQCLINSIPIKEIIDELDMPISYRKVEIKDATMLSRYEVTSLPALLIIKDKETIFKHEGFIKATEKNTLFEKLHTTKPTIVLVIFFAVFIKIKKYTLHFLYAIL